MTMKTIRYAMLLAMLVSGSAVTPTAADDAQPLDQSAQQWVDRLDASSFSARREAARHLEAMGLEAIEALADGARSPGPEVSQRCFDILSQHFESGTANVSEAAKKQLQNLAADADETTAQRAQNVLAPKPKSVPMRPNLPNGQQIRQRIAIRMANGKRTIEVERNGKKTIIRVEGNKHIVERPGNVPATPPAEYKDEKALEKGDPEAYQLLKRFGAGGLKIIQRGPGPLQPGQLRIQLKGLFGKPLAPLPQPPVPQPPVPQPPGDSVPKTTETIEA